MAGKRSLRVGDDRAGPRRANLEFVANMLDVDRARLALIAFMFKHLARDVN